MKILLLGKNGQVGWELHRTLLSLGEVIAFDTPELDYTDLNLLKDQVNSAKPQVIVNAVAYTAVDQAEADVDRATQVNARAPAVLAELASQMHALLVHYSTDFVFDGMQFKPYKEEDQPNPLSVYGRTKLAGDLAIRQVDGAHFVFRTSWVYSQRRDNFVKKVLYWARTRTELSIVRDQTGSPTWARALAEATAQVLAQGISDPWQWGMDHRGLYNVAGSGFASRYEWAQAILQDDPKRGEQILQALKPALAKEFPSPAQRPCFAALDCSLLERTFGLQLPGWRTSLQLALVLE